MKAIAEMIEDIELEDYGDDLIWKNVLKEPMIIEGFEVTCFSDKGECQPLKNKLPSELERRFKTEKQWMELGYNIKENATGTFMHANSNDSRIIAYYLDSEVTKMNQGEIPKNCTTCAKRTQKYFCEIAGGFVGATNGCSEYTSKY